MVPCPSFLPQIRVVEFIRLTPLWQTQGWHLSLSVPPPPLLPAWSWSSLLIRSHYHPRPDLHDFLTKRGDKALNGLLSFSDGIKCPSSHPHSLLGKGYTHWSYCLMGKIRRRWHHGWPLGRSQGLQGHAEDTCHGLDWPPIRPCHRQRPWRDDSPPEQWHPCLRGGC